MTICLHNMVVNDSGVFVPYIRSFPGTSNFQHTRLGSSSRTVMPTVDTTDIPLARDAVFMVSCVCVCERLVASIVALVSTAFLNHDQFPKRLQILSH